MDPRTAFINRVTFVAISLARAAVKSCPERLLSPSCESENYDSSSRIIFWPVRPFRCSNSCPGGGENQALLAPLAPGFCLCFPRSVSAEVPLLGSRGDLAANGPLISLLSCPFL